MFAWIGAAKALGVRFNKLTKEQEDARREEEVAAKVTSSPQAEKVIVS